MKNNRPIRHGLATVELLIAMPILATAFASLMFLAHATYKKNDDFSRKYRTLMSRHTLKPPQFEQSKSVALSRLAMPDSDNVTKKFFPETETWIAASKQTLDYKPAGFESVLPETVETTGKIYKGTGSPEFRTSDLIDPSRDKVEQLALSLAAKAVGNELGQVLDAVDEFQNLLAAIESIEKAVDVDIDDVMNQAKEAGKQALKQLDEFAKELAKELAKTFVDQSKVRELKHRIKMIRFALKQLGLSEGKFAEIAEAAEEYSAYVPQMSGQSGSNN